MALKRDAKQGYREVVQKFGVNFQLFKLFALTWRVPFRVTMGMEFLIREPRDICLSVGDNFVLRIKLLSTLSASCFHFFVPIVVCKRRTV